MDLPLTYNISLLNVIEWNQLVSDVGFFFGLTVSFGGFFDVFFGVASFLFSLDPIAFEIFSNFANAEFHLLFSCASTTSGALVTLRSIMQTTKSMSSTVMTGSESIQ